MGLPSSEMAGVPVSYAHDMNVGNDIHIYNSIHFNHTNNEIDKLFLLVFGLQIISGASCRALFLLVLSSGIREYILQGFIGIIL